MSCGFVDISPVRVLLLVVNGVDLRQIQDYLVHKNVETTVVYTHVVKSMRDPAISPLDMLDQMTGGHEGSLTSE